MSKSDSRSVILAACVSIILTLLIYGSTVTLPYYSDDLLQVPWTEETSLVDFWRTLNPYERYRPIQFTIWKLVWLLVGDLQPATLHVFNLVGHVACGILLGLLAMKLRPRSWMLVPLTVALYIVFPFGFDVISWPCAFAYPLTIALTLGSLLIYLRAREAGPWWLYLLGAALTVLAGFSYEAGIVAGCVVLLAEVTIVEKRFSFWSLLYLAASGLPFLVILSVSNLPAQFMVGFHPTYNPIIALQSLLFPLAPLATRFGENAVAAMGWIGVGGLILLGVAAYRADRLRWFGFGLGWAVLWSTIPLLTLPFNWFRDPPRVLYPGSAGVAILWGASLFTLIPRRIQRIRPVIQAVLGLAVLVPALVFLIRCLDLYHYAGNLLWQAIAATQEETLTLFLNLPDRLSLRERFYPLGHEGVIPLPPPTDADLLVQVHTGRAGVAFDRDAGALVPELPFLFEPSGLPLSPDDVRAADRVLVANYGPDRAGLREPGRVLSPREPAAAVASFGERIHLLSASCERVAADRVTLSMVWQISDPVEEMPTLFVHLWGPDGTLADQADGEPLRGVFPFRWWQPGEVVYDVRAFEDPPPGSLTIHLGIWDPALETRWEAVDADGVPLRDDIFECAVR